MKKQAMLASRPGGKYPLTGEGGKGWLHTVCI